MLDCNQLIERLNVPLTFLVTTPFQWLSIVQRELKGTCSKSNKSHQAKLMSDLNFITDSILAQREGEIDGQQVKREGECLAVI